MWVLPFTLNHQVVKQAEKSAPASSEKQLLPGRLARRSWPEEIRGFNTYSSCCIQKKGGKGKFRQLPGKILLLFSKADWSFILKANSAVILSAEWSSPCPTEVTNPGKLKGLSHPTTEMTVMVSPCVRLRPAPLLLWHSCSFNDDMADAA